MVAATRGRLYANEVMDHPYIRYNVPQDTQNEIDPIIQKQSH